MELKPGYKLTEVGVIPEDWNVVNLDKIASIIDPQPDHRTPPEISGGEPYIGISDFVGDTNVDWDSCRKIIPKALDKQQKSFQISSGDIIFGKIGTIGSPKFLPVTTFRYALSANVILLKPKFEPHFLMSWLRSSLVQKQINQELHSTSQPAFGIRKMRDLWIASPPLSEERSIATALSDMDELLGGLDRLITKKLDLKQSAMQQLLTGKTRLPGFDGEWAEKKIGTEIDLLTGYPFPSDQYFDSGIKLLRGSNIKRGVTDWSDELVQHWPKFTLDLHKYILNEGDIVIAMDGSLVGRSFARLSTNDLPALLLQRVARIRSHQIDMGYLKEWICSKFFTQHCDSVKTVTAIPHISPGNIKNFIIQIPPTQKEQAAIASILSDMDTEIATLEQRRNKTRDLKQAMMQELLTGRIRLL